MDAISSVCLNQSVWWSAALVPPPVSRALGIPCRVVTNFGSAHDTDANLIIENVYDVDGEKISRDSVWWVCSCDTCTFFFLLSSIIPLWQNEPYLLFTDWRRIIMLLSYVWLILPGTSMFGWTAGWLVLIWGQSLMDGKPVTQLHRREVTVNFDLYHLSPTCKAVNVLFSCCLGRPLTEWRHKSFIGDDSDSWTGVSVGLWLESHVCCMSMAWTKLVTACD